MSNIMQMPLTNSSNLSGDYMKLQPKGHGGVLGGWKRGLAMTSKNDATTTTMTTAPTSSKPWNVGQDAIHVRRIMIHQYSSRFAALSVKRLHLDPMA